MKKILFISYFFPPSGSTGALRPLKFAKYLQQFGFQPVVLACKRPFDYAIREDPGLVSQIPPKVKVFRTLSFEPLNLYLRWKGKKKEVDGKVKPQENKKRSSHSIKNFIYDILRTPDNYQGWIPFAFLRGLVIAAQEDVDFILATTPPASALMVGYLLSKFTKKPLIIDYRDPWRKHRSWKFLEKINKWIESMIINQAQYVISVSDTWSKELQNEYNDKDSHKYIVIPNGYDLEDRDIKGCAASGKFTFLHAGYFYSNDGVEDFIDAVYDIVREDSSLKKDLKISFIGKRPPLSNFDALEKLGVAEFKEKLPRNEYISSAVKADVLLVFLRENGRDAGWIPSKIFEYMMFKKPVIAIMPEGEAKDLIEETNLGIVIKHGDKESIKKVIHHFYRCFKNRIVKVDFNEELMKKFERKELTRKLAEVLDSA